MKSPDPHDYEDYLDELPGMWENADLIGGETDQPHASIHLWEGRIFDKGYAAALDRAREAVAAAQAEAGDINFCKDCADWSVAAIDALKDTHVRRRNEVT